MLETETALWWESRASGFWVSETMPIGFPEGQDSCGDAAGRVLTGMLELENSHITQLRAVWANGETHTRI